MGGKAIDYSLDGLLARTARIPDTGCFLWEGATLNGYPVASWHQRVHRLVMQHIHGRKLATKEFVCHRCDVPLCINPAHLYVGTQLDNMRDMYRRGRDGDTAHPGERNHNALLTEDAVREIRATPKKYGNFAALARKYGVCRTAITEVRSGRSWAHVK